MKALVYEGVETLGYRDVADPVVGPDDQLIKIEAVGICGSDMHAYLGHDDRRPAPLILGHEAAGVVVKGTWTGRRVTVNPLVTNPNSSYSKAGRENLCPERQIISMPPREGAFAQYVAMPERNLVEVPDGVDIAKAALAEPLAVSWHTARLGLAALHPSMDRSVLVIGGGAIGLAAALAFRAMGIAKVIISEPNEARRLYLERTCEQTVVAAPKGRFSLVVDAVGFGITRAAACAHVQPGGVIAHVGLGDTKDGFDVRFATLQEVTFIGTYTYTAQDFRDTAQAIFEGRLGALDWSEHRPLADGASAFKDLRAGAVASPKIILAPWG